MKNIIIKIIATCILIFSFILVYNNNTKLKTLSKETIPMLYDEITCQYNNVNTKCLTYNNIIYVPYGSIKPKGINSYRYAYGEVLGYIVNNDSVRIYELAGYSNSEWIIKYTINGNPKEGIVYKGATSTNKNVPDIVVKR